MPQGIDTPRFTRHSYIPRIVFFALAFFTLLAQTMPVAQASGKSDAASSTLLNALQAKAQVNGTVRLIVGLNVPHAPEGALESPSAVSTQRQSIGRAQQGLLQRMANRKVRTTAQFQYIPFIALEADAAAIQALNSDPAVTTIEEDHLSKPALEESIPLIGGSSTGTFGSTNRTGAGQTVAILDTGVMKTHSFLANKVVAEGCYSTTDASQGATAYCTPGSTAPGSGVNCPDSITGCDHGTHVAGIVAGKGATFNGVAKDATLIAMQVFSRFDGEVCGGGTCTMSFTSDQIKALERVYALRGTYKIASVNMSLGGGGPFSTNCDAARSAQKAAIDNLLAVGIATIIASGNESFTTGVAGPACISTAVTVGSTTKWDSISSFSNSGELIDLLAPGSDIWASVASSTTAFAFKSGTSMATPHVAGAWAVMKQQNPNASVAQVLTALQNTGVTVNDTRNNIARKRISLTNAVNALPTGPNPVPAIASFAPASVGNGNLPFTLTVNGSNFVQGAIVRWKGANRRTTFVSPTKLTAAISAADVAAPTTVPVTVFNPAPGGGTSAAKNYVVASSCNRYEVNNTQTPAKPIVNGETQLHSFCTRGDVDWLKFSAAANNRYQITTLGLSTVSTVNTVMSLYDVTGKVLVPEASDASTSPTSAITFNATKAGTYYVKLRNRADTFGPSFTYHVRMTSMVVPFIASLSPASREAGYGAFTLAVKGSGFDRTSVVRWKGVNRPTTFVSASELRAAIGQADIRLAGTYPVTVFTPAPGAGLSNAVNFTVTPMKSALAPKVTTLNRTTAEAGTSGFLLAVRGSNFVPRSVVRFAGVNRPTTFVSASELRITLADADLATAGTKIVKVVTSAPGGGISNGVNFTVTPMVTPCQRDEPNDTFAQAKVLPFDTARVYGFCTDTDKDIIKVNAAASSVYIVDVLNPGSSVDTVVTVYDSTGTSLGSFDSNGWGGIESVKLTTEAGETGAFYFQFHDWWGGFGNDEAHSYSVRVRNVTGQESTESVPSAESSAQQATVRSTLPNTKQQR